jgi:hypothetical protein
MWPRVLRSTIDGKVTVSFVCDEKNPTYGKVEIMYFNDQNKEFKTLELDFGHPKVKAVPLSDRVHHNPTSCISCHGGSKINNTVSLKPNWPEYFFWSDCNPERGIQMYGSSDDNMGPSSFRSRRPANSKDTSGCGDTNDRSMVEKEKVNFQNFRIKQKDNPCFQSLPWKVL